MTLTIFAIIILFLAVMEAAIPYLVKRTVVFGVSIPEEHTNAPELRDYKKRYALIVLAFSMVVFISFYQKLGYRGYKEAKLPGIETLFIFMEK